MEVSNFSDDENPLFKFSGIKQKIYLKDTLDQNLLRSLRWKLEHELVEILSLADSIRLSLR